ncbi:MAG: hypothetical protein ABJK75_05435 [Tateyamaria sp.]|uniref:hypothetical protein n=1 Tax=Tateyamaria sp. TaxID=1929288 RepID=UPI0032A07A63
MQRFYSDRVEQSLMIQAALVGFEPKPPAFWNTAKIRLLRAGIYASIKPAQNAR